MSAAAVLGMYLNSAPKYTHQSPRFCSGLRGSTSFFTTMLFSCLSVLTQHCVVGVCAAPDTLSSSTGQSNSMLTASVIPSFDMFAPVFHTVIKWIIFPPDSNLFRSHSFDKLKDMFIILLSLLRALLLLLRNLCS